MASSKDSKKAPDFGLKGAACATDMSFFGYDQGLFSVTPSTVTAIYDVGCFFGAPVAFSIGKRLGRKKSTLLATTLTTIGTLLKCVSYSLPQIFVGWVILGFRNEINTSTAPTWQTETSAPKWIWRLVFLEMVMNILDFSMVNWINYGLSFAGGATPWLYPPELNSLQMRNKGAAVATATNWVTNFVIVEITPIRIQNICWKFWIVWTVFNAAFLPAIYFFYPETANRTLEDIDAY
ncbi:hypothetical protein BDV38DRAFT_295968 [Aspergillus pseudotamarii]|uniref:General substrate transporter n=1 Tax=Aspergillus pseudotamarii TaxID=132259 RepID=A0A5N6SGG1_ASPPS|nr:uncharacterized protein BDV38DRAFT_295968 [Aspergillus pseudotamarii]KAE8133715.1 hypothetical protein BDV38DRAFT_295968 [Aspergillus pseudotamarii]